jgi:hypothetical protein
VDPLDGRSSLLTLTSTGNQKVDAARVTLRRELEAVLVDGSDESDGATLLASAVAVRGRLHTRSREGAADSAPE